MGILVPYFFKTVFGRAVEIVESCHPGWENME